MSWRTRGGVSDDAVLAELRAIRHEIHELSERVGQAATRDDLKDYVTRAEYEAQITTAHSTVEMLQRWGGLAVGGASMLLYLLEASGVHLVFGK